MSVTSSRTVQIQFNGDYTADLIYSALDNPTSIASINWIDLAVGNNAVTAPIITGFNVTGLTIIPPAGNTVVLELKGITTDSGLPLHVTDPTSLALDTSFLGLVLFVTVAVVGVKLIWT